MIDARVPVLRTRLAELELTVPPAASAPDLYDDALVALVKSYQETKGLTVDGVIGPNTIRSINTSLDDRINQIVVNLERRRWLAEDIGRRYVFVNTGDYSMVFVNNGGRSRVPEPGDRGYAPASDAGDPVDDVRLPDQPVLDGAAIDLGRRIPADAAPRPLCTRRSRGFKIFASWSNNNSELDPGERRLELDQSQGLPLPRAPGAGRQQCSGLHLLPVRQQLRRSTCTTPRRAGCSPKAAATSATAASACRTRSTSSRRCLVAGRARFDKGGRAEEAIDNGDQVHYSFPKSVKLYVTYRTVTAGFRRHAHFPRRRLRPRPQAHRRHGQAAQLTRQSPR